MRFVLDKRLFCRKTDIVLKQIDVIKCKSDLHLGICVQLSVKRNV